MYSIDAWTDRSGDLIQTQIQATKTQWSNQLTFRLRLFNQPIPWGQLEAEGFQIINKYGQGQMGHNGTLIQNKLYRSIITGSWKVLCFGLKSYHAVNLHKVMHLILNVSANDLSGHPSCMKSVSSGPQDCCTNGPPLKRHLQRQWPVSGRNRAMRLPSLAADVFDSPARSIPLEVHYFDYLQQWCNSVSMDQNENCL